MENTNKTESIVTTIGKGIIFSIAFTLILLFIFSIILTYTQVKETVIPPVIITITAISILMGSSISTMKVRNNGIFHGAIIGIIYIGMLYLISSLVTKGFSFNVNSILMILFSIIAGMIGGIIGVNRKK